MKLTLFIILFLSIGMATGGDFPKLDPDDIDGIQITRADYYDGSSLWGYINGGADLYLDYGFDKLLVEEFSVKGENLKLEVWKMNSPLIAFGIYSVNHRPVETSEKFNYPVCITDYQYQLVLKDYYISIISENGSDISKEISKEVAGVLKRKIGNKKADNDLPFTEKFINENINSMKFMNCRLGIQKGYPDWLDSISEGDNFTVFVFYSELANSELTVGYLKDLGDINISQFADYYEFDKFELVESGIETSDNDYLYFLKQLGDDEFVFIESSTRGFDFNNYLEEILRSE